MSVTYQTDNMYDTLIPPTALPQPLQETQSEFNLIALPSDLMKCDPQPTVQPTRPLIQINLQSSVDILSKMQELKRRIHDYIQEIHMMLNKNREIIELLDREKEAYRTIYSVNKSYLHHTINGIIKTDKLIHQKWDSLNFKIDKIHKTPRLHPFINLDDISMELKLIVTTRDTYHSTLQHIVNFITSKERITLYPMNIGVFNFYTSDV